MACVRDLVQASSGLEVLRQHTALVGRETGSNSRPDLSIIWGRMFQGQANLSCKQIVKGSIPFVSIAPRKAAGYGLPGQFAKLQTAMVVWVQIPRLPLSRSTESDAENTAGRPSGRPAVFSPPARRRDAIILPPDRAGQLAAPEGVMEPANNGHHEQCRRDRDKQVAKDHQGEEEKPRPRQKGEGPDGHEFAPPSRAVGIHEKTSSCSSGNPGEGTASAEAISPPHGLRADYS